ncbi:MAG TPA: type IV toxin-antitoxin system AbiEi family antitoxin domain-containing protein [Solirubrobacteraceae bacterium]
MGDPIDKRIAALAKRQHGYVRRAELLRLGLGREMITRRIKSGRLIPVYRGVYAVGHLPQHPLDRAYAALLACGGKAVLSHASAATVYGVYRRWEPPFDVTAPSVRQHKGIRIHRATLTREDVTVQLGLRVTSPSRTLLDMAPRLSDKQLRRAFNNLRLSHGLQPHQLTKVIDRFPGHPGVGGLRPLAATTRNPTRSKLEDKFADFCERHGLPEPLLNHKINGREVDAFFPEHRLIVEVDGRDTHAGPVSFEDDRERDAAMLALGLATVRVTEERIDNEPEREAARLLRILAARRRAA